MQDGAVQHTALPDEVVLVSVTNCYQAVAAADPAEQYCAVQQLFEVAAALVAYGFYLVCLAHGQRCSQQEACNATRLPVYTVLLAQKQCTENLLLLPLVSIDWQYRPLAIKQIIWYQSSMSMTQAVDGGLVL